MGTTPTSAPRFDGPRIRSWLIEDPLDDPGRGAVEVTIELEDGRSRCCVFFTPERLSLVGDWVPGTRVRMHLGVSHMIVVSDLTPETVGRVLRHLESSGVLLEHTHSAG